MTVSSSSFYLNWIVDRHSDLDSSFLKSLKHLHLKVPPGTCQALALSKAKDSRPQKMRTRLTGLTFKCQNKLGSIANNGSLVQLQNDDSFPNPDKALIFTMTELLGKVLWALVLFPGFHNPQSIPVGQPRSYLLVSSTLWQSIRHKNIHFSSQPGWRTKLRWPILPGTTPQATVRKIYRPRRDSLTQQDQACSPS